MNKEYAEKMIKENQEIVIDTSSLFDCERLQYFINNHKTLLLNEKKKILVPDCVMSEIAKFTCSVSVQKRENAYKVLEILRYNHDIFMFDESYELPENEENFADPKILKYLLEHRRTNKQLLISNDRGLSKDAFNFNKMESFNGNTISVCYLSNLGDIKKCDCVNYCDDKEPSIEIIYKDRIIEKHIHEEKTFLETYGLPIGLVFGSITTFGLCYWKNILKFSKAYFA